MASLVKISGLRNVIRNIIKTDDKLGKAFARGLKKGGSHLQRLSQLVVPVLTSDLKGSADTRNIGGAGFKTDIAVSFSTDYAVYVHENLEARHKPGKIAKYLERPAREKKREIIGIIADEVRKVR